MLRKLKFIFWLAGVLLALVIGAVLVVTTLVDPNDYKPGIEKYVESKTGRQLKIEGDLELTFYPWIGLKTGAAEISNPSGFGDSSMISADEISVKVKLIPLLKKSLQVGDVILVKPVLHLITARNGSTNWDDLINKGSSGEQNTENQGTSGALAIAGLAVQGVSIVDGEVLWENRTTNQLATLSRLMLTTGVIQPDEPLDIGLSAMVEGNVLPVPVEFSLSTTVIVNRDFSNVILQKTSTRVDLDGKTINLLTPSLNFNVESQIMRIPGFELSQGDLVIRGSLTSSSLSGEPALSGQVSLKTPNAISTLQETGIVPNGLETMNQTIENLELETGFSYINDTVELNNLTGKINLNGKETKVQLPFGTISLADQKVRLPELNIKQEGLSLRSRIDGSQVFSDQGTRILNGEFDIKFVNLRSFLVDNDLVEFLPAEYGEIGATGLQAQFSLQGDAVELESVLINSLINGEYTTVKAKSAQFGLSSQRMLLSEISVAQDNLNLSADLSGRGNFATPDEIQLAGMLKLDVSQLPKIVETNGLEGIVPESLINSISNEVDIKLENGNLVLSSMKSLVNDTVINGDARFENLISEMELRIDINQKITNIDAGKVLAAFDITDYFEGVGDGTLNISGLRPGAEKPNAQLGGLIEFSLRDGAIKGFDLQGALMNLDSVLKQAKGLEETKYKPDAQTRFSVLSASFNGSNGRFDTDNILMKAPGIRVRGQGAIDLAREIIDLDFDVSVVDTVEGQGGQALEDLKGVTIPLEVTGDLNAPSYGLDISKLLAREAKREIRKLLEAELSKDDSTEQVDVSPEDQLEKKLEEKLTETLLDLFAD